MKVLVIDTALGACTAALFECGREVAARSEPMIKGHAERIAGFVRDVMAGQDWSSLDRIGVTVGPGSFTGLRVGLAFAQGLAEALDRPVVGISTLEALARSVDTSGPIAAAIDARRGQVYFQPFTGDAADGPPEPLALAEAQARASGVTALIGTGAPLLAEAAPNAAQHVVEAPSPVALAELTEAADPSVPAAPLYLRAPDATPPTRLPGQRRA